MIKICSGCQDLKSKDIFYASLVCAHYQLLCFTASELVVLRSNENLSPVILLMTLQHFCGCIYRYNFSSRGYIKMERLGFVLVPLVMLLRRLNSYLCLVTVRGCHFEVLGLCGTCAHILVSVWPQYCHSWLPGCFRGPCTCREDSTGRSKQNAFPSRDGGPHIKQEFYMFIYVLVL